MKVIFRKSCDQAEVYADIKAGFRPCDIAKKHQISRRRVYQIKDKFEAEDAR
ncbi:helix-turn-helix domain-containing protein [Photobacterium damselae]|uniref:helix-turn-helix domain-containing protein n=1 Tax=Photobacterium damselae TaxID=38293 RepID=UPI003D7F0F13